MEEDPLKPLIIGLGLAFLAQFAIDVGEYFASPGAFSPYSGARLFLLFAVTSLLPGAGMLFVSFEKKHAVLSSFAVSLFLFAVTFYVMSAFAVPLNASVAQGGSMTSALTYDLAVFLYALSGAVVAVRAEHMAEHKNGKRA